MYVSEFGLIVGCLVVFIITGIVNFYVEYKAERKRKRLKRLVKPAPRILTGLVMVLLSVQMVARAQDTFYVCRDPRFAWVRLEFRNVPADWLDPDGVGYWYKAEAGAMYGSTLVTDATTQPDYQLEALGIGVGSAIIGKGDYSASLVGNADSPHCDPTTSPIQDEGLEIVLTPSPEATPSACPAIAINRTDNQWYCYTPSAGGVVAIPPAP